MMIVLPSKSVLWLEKAPLPDTMMVIIGESWGMWPLGVSIGRRFVIRRSVDQAGLRDVITCTDIAVLCVHWSDNGTPGSLKPNHAFLVSLV